jgi:hypothetical protein
MDRHYCAGMFKRKKRTLDSTEPIQTLLGSDQPRQHHYLFGHRELPAVARRFSANLVRLVEEDRIDEALAQTWRHVGEQLPEADRLSGEGLTASLHDTAMGQILVVTMPPAEHTTEPHFAAVVLSPDQNLRYFVLEHSWTLNNEPSTVLGEWNDQGHINMGSGPEPEIGTFVRAVETLLITH